jgi:hypothetical protein
MTGVKIEPELAQPDASANPDESARVRADTLDPRSEQEGESGERGHHPTLQAVVSVGDLTAATTDDEPSPRLRADTIDPRTDVSDVDVGSVPLISSLTSVLSVGDMTQEMSVEDQLAAAHNQIKSLTSELAAAKQKEAMANTMKKHLLQDVEDLKAEVNSLKQQLEEKSSGGEGGVDAAAA